MELLYFVKNLRKAKSFTHLALTKTHRKLIPYFNENLLSVDPSFNKHLSGKIDMKNELKALVKKA